MVVLEGGGMLTSSSNQYLQPDYLSPLPTTLDAKKSPLALLAQTCSQIGADSPSTKSLLPPLDKPKKEHTSSSVSVASSAERASADKSEKHSHSISPSETTSSSVSSSVKLAFKPYENNPISRQERPTSKVSSENGVEGKKSPSSHGSRTPATGRKSQSPSNNNNNNSPKPSAEKSESPRTSGASPIIRSGLEILQGHQHKDLAASYKSNGFNPALSSSALSALCAGCPPGLEAAAAAAASNPAFRPPFPGFAHSMLAAGYPPSALGMPPYVSYARVKTPSGGETLVPVCKDPYCTGCQLSMHNAQLLAAAASQQSQHCPSGCTQCDHHKYGLAAALSLMQQSGGPPASHLASYSHQLGAAAAAAAAAASSGRPYVCSWIAGENYCGKRFSTSDELLQHLRSHTAAAEAAGTLLSPSANPSHPLLSQRYPNPPLSPLSAARYHPYSKPGGLPPSLASPFSAFNPTAMGPYYPYSFYGPRLGAAVHQ